MLPVYNAFGGQGPNTVFNQIIGCQLTRSLNRQSSYLAMWRQTCCILLMFITRRAYIFWHLC